MSHAEHLQRVHRVCHVLNLIVCLYRMGRITAGPYDRAVARRLRRYGVVWTVAAESALEPVPF